MLTNPKCTSRILIGLTLPLLALWVNAAEIFPAEFDPTPVAHFNLTKTPAYAQMLDPIKALVFFEKKKHLVNHFCIVGYTWANQRNTAWVHWTEEKRLILWEPSEDKDFNEASLMHSRRDLSFKKDTVKTAKAIQGSTYLVTRAWWQAVAVDCANHGQKIKVKAYQ
ncbi:MAG: hypothetical protein WBP13_02055 [Methylophilaceae bacterium]